MATFLAARSTVLGGRTYNTLRPHQALDDRTPRQAYVTGTGPSNHRSARPVGGIPYIHGL